MQNEMIELIKNRTSTKKFRDTPVPQELLDTIIEAGTWAPTGKNLQSPIILAITNKEVRDALSRENARILGADIDPFYNAPAVLVVLSDRNAPTYLYDGSVVMENLQLAAEALGLGAYWIHRAKEEFDSDFGKELLKKAGIEGDYEGIGHCVIGSPDAEFKPKPRKENWVYRID